ncbi:pilus assembly protein TadG-related protein [Agromyces sp. MMS24-K17]|uniref:pilus assembly protein TadG-related protein n=1 Tax=Agromyces sp. MMS24-K17 TaxID=3372850 RepID=UPI00375484BB
MRRGILRRLRRDESGSTLLLTIAYGVLGLALILLVLAATSLYLERKRLFTVADGAALAAAEAWSIDTVRIEGERLAFDLDSAAVAASAGDYLADAPTGLHDVELVRAVAVDGSTAAITLRAVWVAPISSPFLPVEVPIEVTSTARSVFH